MELEGQILWQLVRHCSSEETNSRTKMYHQTNRKCGLERITEKEIMEEKVRKRGYTMTFPTKEEVNFALRLENFDLPNNGKESRYASLSFCRGSRVEGSMSRVEGTMSRVEGNIFFSNFWHWLHRLLPFPKKKNWKKKCYPGPSTWHPRPRHGTLDPRTPFK